MTTTDKVRKALRASGVGQTVRQIAAKCRTDPDACFFALVGLVNAGEAIEATNDDGELVWCSGG